MGHYRRSSGQGRVRYSSPLLRFLTAVDVSFEPGGSRRPMRSPRKYFLPLRQW